MNLESNFFKTLAIVSDFLAVATVISAIPFALLRKNENLLAFRISKFLHYMLRTAITIVASLLIFNLSELIYFLLLLPLKRSITDSNYLWEEGREWHHILAYFVSGAIGLSIIWVVTSFIWTSSLNLSKEFLNLFLPKSKLLIKQESPLEILSAVYKTDNGQIDVTSIVRQMVSNNHLTIRASNELAGDPDPGVIKTLIINYRIGRKNSERRLIEGEVATIPD